MLPRCEDSPARPCVASLLRSSSGRRPRHPRRRRASLCTLKPGQATLAARNAARARASPAPVPRPRRSPRRRSGAPRSGCSRASALRRSRWRDVTAAGGERVRHPPREARARATTPSATCTPSIAATAPTGTILDPRRPESLIYATEPGRRPRADRRHVQRAPRRARADAGRPDRPLALPPRLRERATSAGSRRRRRDAARRDRG